MNFSPCLDIFFDDLSFAQRMEIISKLGFTHFEFWSWWDKDMNEIAELSQQLQINPVAYCTRFISLVDSSLRNLYLEGLQETINQCQKTNTKIIISQVGDEIPGSSRDVQQQSLIDGLKEAAKLLEGTDIKLAIEPLNTFYDHKGYYLYSSSEAVDILDSVDHPNIKMLFDVYHQQIMEGNLINNISRYIDHIAHFHIADVPGRHEIGTGEINFKNVLDAVAKSSYQGCVGIELFPQKMNHAEALNNPLFKM